MENPNLKFRCKVISLPSRVEICKTYAWIFPKLKTRKLHNLETPGFNFIFMQPLILEETNTESKTPKCLEHK
jgi:hypothetical protein